MARRGLRRAGVPAFVGGVALTTALGVGAVTVTPPPTPRTSDVDLAALITHGSATNWNADGIDKFYGLDWNAKYGPTVVSQFSLFPYNVNPDNLTAALRNNVGDDKPDLVLTSGRGSGAATVTMLLLLNSGRPEDRELVLNTRWILDNSVNRPNGGYGSRYIPFSILGVYPWPTPTDEGVDIVDVGYEYAWNSSAPAYVTNLVALLNSIIAYAYRYKSQAFTGLPVDPDNPDAKDPVTGEPILEKGYHYIVGVDGTVTKVPLDSLGNTNTAYVTYRAAGLPMLQPLRDWGGTFGNAVADLLEPALKIIVDASYPDGDPVANPDRYITASLFAPLDVTLDALKKLPDAINEGVENFRKALAPQPKPESTTELETAGAKPESETTGVQRTLDSADTPAADTPAADTVKTRWKRALSRDRAAAAGEADGAGESRAERPRRAPRIADRLSKVLGPRQSPVAESNGPTDSGESAGGGVDSTD